MFTNYHFEITGVKNKSILLKHNCGCGQVAKLFIGDVRQSTAGLLIGIQKMDGFEMFRLPLKASQLNLDRIQEAFTILGVTIVPPHNAEPEEDAMEVETVREEPVMDVQSMEVDPSEELDSTSRWEWGVQLS